MKRAAASKKAGAKGKGLKKTIRKKTASVPRRKAGKREKDQEPTVLGFLDDVPRSPSGGQSGDLQGLSNVETADSESVDELVEEGNAFEAGIVSGVEEAGRRGTREVRTREVPEDDVPEEYLDED